MLYGLYERKNNMNLTDRQKEIIINYLLSIKGEAKSIPRNFVVMRTEVDEIISLLRAK
jgi:hypothetical protein